MAPRIDKYEPLTGGFRARCAAAWSGSDVGKVFGVGLDTNGRLVKGKGNSGQIRGLVVCTRAYVAGEVVDVMTDGEIADFTYLNDGTTATTAGTDYYVDNTGGVPTATSTSNVYVGTTVADASYQGRLVVRVAR